MNVLNVSHLYSEQLIKVYAQRKLIQLYIHYDDYYT